MLGVQVFWSWFESGGRRAVMESEDSIFQRDRADSTYTPSLHSNCSNEYLPIKYSRRQGGARTLLFLAAFAVVGTSGAILLTAPGLWNSLFYVFCGINGKEFCRKGR